MPSPGVSSLTGHAVDVWFIRLDVSRQPSKHDLRTLSADESQRAAGMAATPRRRFVAARALLRNLLASYLSTEAKSIEFSYAERGKPRLAGRHSDHGMHFNVSHSQHRALFAFGRAPLGVDLETIRPLRDMDGLAGRFLSHGECKTLNELPVPLRRRAFFACWTRKEAYVKAVGTGIGLPLRSFDVTLSPGSVPALLGENGERDPNWTLLHLEPEEGVVAALAVGRPKCSVRCWRLESPNAPGP